MPLPDRWLNYEPVGSVVPGTRFIAFKVPLTKGKTERLPFKDRFTGESLLANVPNLGLIIDLTNTDRYYNPKFFLERGVDHKKIKIAGHYVPTPDKVEVFKQTVDDFLKCNPSNEKLIGVHCTHGVNRTGFFICNYMITKLNMSPSEAIEKFRWARGHGIERQNYIEALMKLEQLQPSLSNSLNCSPSPSQFSNSTKQNQYQNQRPRSEQSPRQNNAVRAHAARYPFNRATAREPNDWQNPRTFDRRENLHRIGNNDPSNRGNIRGAFLNQKYGNFFRNDPQQK